MTIKIKANKDKAALLGNAVNIIILVVAIGYQVLTFGHFSEWWTLERFGTNWAQDGFCLSFKDTLYHTHLLCLYGDMVLAAGLVRKRGRVQYTHLSLITTTFEPNIL